MKRADLSTLAINLALAVAYAGVAKLGLMMDAVSGFATLVWPPTGMALAAVLLGGNRVWPGIALGAFAVNLWTGAPVLVAAGIAAGNTLEAVVAALALRRVRGAAPWLDGLRRVVALIVVAALGSTAVSATVGVLSLMAGGIVQSAHAVETWRAWWVGDALGDLVVAPLILAWVGAPRLRWIPARVVEALGLALLFASVAVFVFFRPFAPRAGPFDQPYLVFPLFMWAALRFGLRGGTLSMFVLSGVAIWGTARGAGPFAGEGLARNLLFLQTFLGVAAATELVLGGTVMDRARALRARSDLIAVVSHDLTHPVNTIKLSAGLLAKKAPEDDRKLHDMIGRAIEQMTHLIRDLLDSATIDEGGVTLVLGDHRADDLVRDAVELFRPLAKERDIALETDAETGRVVRCDRDRVLQILSNLIGNAIKFSPAGGRVVVRAAASADVCTFSVCDRGRGMSAAQARRAFERYWQATPEAHVGVGLGLFIAKGLVEAQRGTIWVDTAPGSGSTFFFTLPYAGAA
jgi:signal transduction histidine kinase